MQSNVTSWESFNDLLLHGTTDRFTKLLARYELFKRVIDIPGEIVECGVFKGTGLLYWARLVQLFNPISRRTVVGFDTFSGYPETTGEADMLAGKEFNAEANSVGYSMQFIRECACEVGVEGRVELVAGDATKTVHEFVAANPGFRIALLNLDYDTYEPTIEALKAFYPRLVPGGIIAFDEYAVRQWGESNAVDEFFSGHQLELKSFPWALSPTAYMVRTTCGK